MGFWVLSDIESNVSGPLLITREGTNVGATRIGRHEGLVLTRGQIKGPAVVGLV
jgi:hypothetical protein